MHTIRALVFDVFGTLVDWRGSIAREVRAALGVRVPDPEVFADDWRAQYQPAMEKVRSGEWPFSKLDVLHRLNLDRVLADRGLHDVPDAVRADLNLAWHRLDAWPDVTPALVRLRERFRIAPCSNGNISLMVDLARRNNIHWDAILGAEIAGDYKPKLRVYQAAAEALGIKPSECMMVAAHSDDLKFAAAAGLRTGHVAKLNEFGPNTGEPGPKVPVDAAAPDMVSFAKLLKA